MPHNKYEILEAIAMPIIPQRETANMLIKNFAIKVITKTNVETSGLPMALK
ncbi:MAG: hypothetical protein Q8R31_06050 [Candidatus Omnitrophota bacterium]|nr:hypothetical protein [Candidatus Omnitrophota bacterium]